MLEGDLQAERPRHGRSEFVEMLWRLPALETLVVDLHQSILMLDSEDELASDACHLGKDLLVVQA